MSLVKLGKKQWYSHCFCIYFAFILRLFFFFFLSYPTYFIITIIFYVVYSGWMNIIFIMVKRHTGSVSEWKYFLFVFLWKILVKTYEQLCGAGCFAFILLTNGVFFSQQAGRELKTVTSFIVPELSLVDGFISQWGGIYCCSAASKGCVYFYLSKLWICWTLCQLEWHYTHLPGYWVLLLKWQQEEVVVLQAD